MNLGHAHGASIPCFGDDEDEGQEERVESKEMKEGIRRW